MRSRHGLPRATFQVIYLLRIAYAFTIKKKDGTDLFTALCPGFRTTAHEKAFFMPAVFLDSAGSYPASLGFMQPLAFMQEFVR